jgi:hypothetical protein
LMLMNKCLVAIFGLNLLKIKPETNLKRLFSQNLSLLELQIR